MTSQHSHSKSNNLEKRKSEDDRCLMNAVTISLGVFLFLIIFTLIIVILTIVVNK
jgi:cell division protein FtsB